MPYRFSKVPERIVAVVAVGLLLGDVKAELLHHWDLKESRWADTEVKDLAGGKTARASSPPQFKEGALVVDDACHVEAAGISHEELPESALSVEAWVFLNRGQRWGNVIGYMQDNGSYERGWSLGYNETSYVFWLSTGGGMISVSSDRPFELNEWAHLAATFDGQEIRLYVDGELAGKTAAAGKIAYPEKARYTIGAYRDDNEFYPMFGRILSAKVYDHALEDEEIQAPAGRPKPLRFTICPALQFLAPGRAQVTWKTDSNRDTEVVEWGMPEATEMAAVGSIENENGDREALLTGLEPQSIYQFQIRGGSREQPQRSRLYELNTALNFTTASFPKEPISSRQEQFNASGLVNRLGVREGYAVFLGNVDNNFGVIQAVARETELTVFGFDTDRDRVDRIRRSLYGSNAYGGRISLMAVGSLGEIPVTSGMADAVICGERSNEDLFQEAVRIAAPGGRVLVREGDRWQAYPLPKAAGAGEWTHQYGDPGNTTTSGESLGGARKTDDLVVQWFGRPGADFGLDRQSRMPAPLAADGRLFHQGMNRLVALNAANGAVLWGMEIPDLMRLNMPRDASNWCVDSNSLYVAVRERAWVLEADSGYRAATLPVPTSTEKEPRDWGYIGRVGDRLIGSAVKPDSGYRSYWSGKMWFDGKAGAVGTAKVCSDALFAYSSETGKLAWSYQSGTIINTTIAARDGRVVFVESRNPKLKPSRTSQIAGPELWQDQYLVAVDLESGEKLWEQSIDTEDGTITFYLQAAKDAILVTASNTQYHLYAFAADSGKPLWSRSNPWPSADHSGHIQHPVILDGTIYLQPNGYSLATGKIVTTKVGSRSGCHTYIGAKNALIFRGAGRRVALWDREAETVTAWDRLRPSCWLSLIPANGMLLVPEGGGGCSCGGWMETSIGFAPLDFGKPSEAKSE